MTTKYTHYCMLMDIRDAVAAKGIRMPAHASRPLAATENYEEIRDITKRAVFPLNHSMSDDELQQIRILNDSIRYQIEGELMVAAIFLDDILPKRPDYRNAPRPLANYRPGDPVSSDMNILMMELARESIDYLNYTMRMALNCDEYYCYLPYLERSSVVQAMIDDSARYQSGASMTSERMLCRTVSKMDENGRAGMSVANLNQELRQKELMLREMMPLMHNLSKHSRRLQSPFGRFTNGAISLLVKTIGADTNRPKNERTLSQEEIDTLMDLVSEFTYINSSMLRSADVAQSLLGRLANGEIVFAEMFALLKTQHGLMVGSFNDISRQMAYTIHRILPRVANRNDWRQYLLDSRILIGYSNTRETASKQAA